MTIEQRDDAATIRLLRAECRGLQEQIDRLIGEKIQDIGELNRTKWESRYWRVIALSIGAVLAATLVLLVELR